MAIEKVAHPVDCKYAGLKDTVCTPLLPRCQAHSNEVKLGHSRIWDIGAHQWPEEKRATKKRLYR